MEGEGEAEKQEKVGGKEEEMEEEGENEPANQLDGSDAYQPFPPSAPSASSALQCAETLSHAGAETGNEAPRDLTEEEKGSAAASQPNGDIYPTWPSHDKEPQTEGASLTQTASVTDSSLSLSEEETPRSEEPERLETPSLTSSSGGHRAETAADDIRDITPELRTGCRLEQKQVSLMDAAAESSLTADEKAKSSVRPQTHPAQEALRWT
ncbi:males-absent on the first protein-like [Perca flavescens]|uniref:males-absent on the first protein-like n=1 Tax=Perca flavescens TaxID=8167 RepID=UPI00106EE5C4|nr:males-absent on the first protein-like [Perca flavescens]